MKTKTAIVVAMVGALVLLTGSALFGANLTLGDYTYTTNAAGQATITGFNQKYSGALAITNTLGDCPVSILGNAFNSCTGLTSVTIPTSVINIGDNAFSGCLVLTNITVDAANANFSSLDGVLFDKERTTLIRYQSAKVGSYAVPAGVTNIQWGAFQDYRTGLTDIAIPASVTSIGFLGSTNLTAITVDPANQNYCSLDGVLFNKSRTTLIRYPASKTGNYVIPASVTSLGWAEFADCTGLTSITIPGSVTNIASDAFIGCFGLTAITVDAANSNYSSLEGVLFDKSQTKLIRCPGGKAGSCTIPAVVTSIGNSAFSGCTRLTTVAIPTGVTSIGEAAFLSCSSLTSVTIPAGVTSFGHSAFAGCTSLTSVEIPASVTGIGSHAFNGCSGLRMLTLHASVTNIPHQAFSYCTGLTNVTIPTGVTTIGPYSFGGCTGLKNVSIPTGVTSIEFSAFIGCTGLTSVEIPASVTSIGNGVFIGCTSLTNISIPAGVTNIESQVFRDCRRLTSITIPTSVTSFGNSAFSGCTSLTSVMIPTNVTCIGERAFSACTGLTNITIPASVTNFGYDAFWGCTNLPAAIQNLARRPGFSRARSIPFQRGNDGTSAPAPVPLILGDYTYTTNAAGQATITGFNKNYAGALVITNTLGGRPVTILGPAAFKSCTGLTSITIPASVTNIGDASSFCPFPAHLTNITVDAANKNFSSLDGVLFDKERTTLILHPKGRAGSYAVPASVTSIGRYVFSGCTGLRSITVDAANTNYSSLDGVLFNKDQTALIKCAGGKAGSYAIPATVNTIKMDAFWGCADLTSVTIPAGVTNIGFRAFADCTGLTSITIPASVTSIGDRAFCKCTGLTNITLSAGVTWIGNCAFADCTGLTSVIIPTSVTGIGGLVFQGCTNLPDAIQNLAPKSVIHSPRTIVPLTCGDYTYTINAAGATITGFNKTYTGALVITNSLGGSLVTGIRGAAFQNCTNLTGVTIPDGVTYIGNSAFQKCSGLTSVTIPISVTSIGTGAFDGCTGLTSVTIPTNVTSIGDMAFYGCAGLTNITIPASVTSIGVNVFQGCTNLPSAIQNLAPKGPTPAPGTPPFAGRMPFRRSTDGTSTSGLTLGDYTYMKNGPVQATITGFNTNYTGALVITNTLDGSAVIRIGHTVFLSNTNLTSVTIPDGVTSIGWEAFRGCTGLTNVIIPDDVTSIERSAFASCTGLMSVTIPGSVTSIGREAFRGCTGLTNITIPAGVAFIGKDAFSDCPNLPTTHRPVDSLPVSTTAGDNFITINFRGTPVLVVLDYYSHLTGLTLLWSPAVPPTAITFEGEANSPDQACRMIEATLKYNGICIIRAGKTFAKVVPWTEDVSANGLDQLAPATVTVDGKAKFEMVNFSGTPVEIVLRFYAEKAGRLMGLSKDLPKVSITLRSEKELSLQEFLQGIDNVLLMHGIKLIVLDGGALGAIPSVTPESKLAEVIAALIMPIIAGDYTYTTNAIGQATITGFNKKYAGALAITNTLSGCPVTSIGSDAFNRCANLTSVTIPASVISIAERAFSGCAGLTNITIPASVTNFGFDAFSGCTNLPSAIQNLAPKRPSPPFAGRIPFRRNNYESFASASGPGATSASLTLGDYTYTTNAAGQATITGFNKTYTGALAITNTLGSCPVTSIRVWTFEGCTGLTSVTIPAGVTNIGDHAFYSCNGLANITIPASVTSIGWAVFSGCTGLTSVTIPASVTRIGEMAFYQCTGLTNIIIPASVTSIGYRAFYGCTNLPPAIQNLVRKEPSPSSTTAPAPPPPQ